MTLGWPILVAMVACATASAAPFHRPKTTVDAINPPTSLRGGRVDWVRLVTPDPYWNRHADADRALLRFLRNNTSLNLGPEVQSVSVAVLDDLCAYPFVFAQSIDQVDSQGRRNLGEYLRRGGFLFVDACVNASVNPDLDNRFWRRQVAVLASELPDLQVKTLPPDDEIFSIYFKMDQFPPSALPGHHAPLRALLWHGRTVGIIAISGLQCGRAGFGEPDSPGECLEMTANIYLYAITR